MRVNLNIIIMHLAESLTLVEVGVPDRALDHFEQSLQLFAQAPLKHIYGPPSQRSVVPLFLAVAESSVLYAFDFSGVGGLKSA